MSSTAIIAQAQHSTAKTPSTTTCRLGSFAWQLLPELHRKQRDIRITSKRTYDAFHETELLGVLRDLGVSTLIIAGVETNCESCQLAALLLGTKFTWCMAGAKLMSGSMQQCGPAKLISGKLARLGSERIVCVLHCRLLRDNCTVSVRAWDVPF